MTGARATRTATRSVCRTRAVDATMRPTGRRRTAIDLHEPDAHQAAGLVCRASVDSRFGVARSRYGRGANRAMSR